MILKYDLIKYSLEVKAEMAWLKYIKIDYISVFF